MLHHHRFKIFATVLGIFGVAFVKALSGNTNSNVSKAARSLCTVMHSCFVIFRFMERGQCPITIILFCSFILNLICCIHLLDYH